MPPYRRRPVVVEAVQLSHTIKVLTNEGEVIGFPGDWLIIGVRGEQYVCQADVFAETYDPVDAGSTPQHDPDTPSAPDIRGTPIEQTSSGPCPGRVCRLRQAIQAEYEQRRQRSEEELKRHLASYDEPA